ncbi:MAG: MetS family NSS transporter small subunit [Bacillaceae bacterium]|nr:MetS family NSS transporter small subunit [Bacillaceae bacterium]
MEASAFIMMVVGITIIWGGLGTSIWWAVKKAQENRQA